MAPAGNCGAGVHAYVYGPKPPLTVAAKVTVTGAVYGPTGAVILATTVGGGGGTTVTDRDAVTDRPNASVTVRVTGWEPTVANVVLGEAEVDVGGAPPVKVHA